MEQKTLQSLFIPSVFYPSFSGRMLLIKPGSSSTPSLPSPFPNHQHLHHSAAAKSWGKTWANPAAAVDLLPSLSRSAPREHFAFLVGHAIPRQ